MKIILLFAVILALLTTRAGATCPTFHTLANGSPADATQVMDNFDHILQCPNFTGYVGIGEASAGADLSFPNLTGSSAADGMTWFSPSPLSYGIYKSSGAWGAPDYQQLTLAFSTGIVIDGGTAYGRSGTSLQPNGGNVGVGTTKPSTPLHIETIGAGSQSLLTLAVPNALGNGASINFAVNTGGSVLPVAAIASEYSAGSNIGLSFKTYSAGLAERVRIDSYGNVGIGTSTPGQKLDVAGSIRQSNCTTAGTLSANTSGDIICTSDARLKNILGNYRGGLDALMQITPQRFTFKPTKSNPVETFVHAGFIAQDVMAAIPEASAKQRDGYYSLDTTAVLAAAVNAIKQLKVINDAQRSEIAELRSTKLTQAAQARLQNIQLQKISYRLAELEQRAEIRTASAPTTGQKSN